MVQKVSRSYTGGKGWGMKRYVSSTRYRGIVAHEGEGWAR